MSDDKIGIIYYAMLSAEERRLMVLSEAIRYAFQALERELKRRHEICVKPY